MESHKRGSSIRLQAALSSHLGREQSCTAPLPRPMPTTNTMPKEGNEARCSHCKWARRRWREGVVPSSEQRVFPGMHCFIWQSLENNYGGADSVSLTTWLLPSCTLPLLAPTGHGFAQYELKLFFPCLTTYILVFMSWLSTYISPHITNFYFILLEDKKLLNNEQGAGHCAVFEWEVISGFLEPAEAAPGRYCCLPRSCSSLTWCSKSLFSPFFLSPFPWI